METADLIDFRSDETHLLLNPRMPDAERRELERLFAASPDLPGHIWISTSGTTGRLKLTALSKAAFRASAAAVNEHLDAGSADVWACVLPHFHVGGLGIHARATLKESRVIDLAWDPHNFHRTCVSEQVTLSALVPAQLSDLVRGRLSSPPSLRAMIIGGGALLPSLYDDARELGWPILPSYGMTETCSQVATARLSSLQDAAMPPMTLLSHVQARSIEGRLAFRGPSLLTGYASFDSERPTFRDPKNDEGWFVSEDRGSVFADGDANVLLPEGRGTDYIKIGGEAVDLARLDRILENLLRSRFDTDAALIAVPDQRLGHVLHLAVTAEGAVAEKLAAEFAAAVLPYERPRAVHTVPEIPRSPLRKLLRAKLAELMARQHDARAHFLPLE